MEILLNLIFNLVIRFYTSTLIFPLVIISVFIITYTAIHILMGRRGRDRMVVGFTTTYAISAYCN
jgi:uncharacterized protein (DUF2062 family)